MDNNQLKMISLTLLILVIVFSAGTTWKIIDNNQLAQDSIREISSNNVITSGEVSIDIQKPRSPQKGEVSIEILSEGDTI